MDIENVIYLLAGIGWFFWRAYRQSQKNEESAKPARNRKRHGRTDEPKSGGPFRSLEDLILEQMEQKKPEPEPVASKPTPYVSRRNQNQDKFLNVDLDHYHLPDDYQMSSGEGGSHRVQRQVHRLKEQHEEKEESLLESLFPEEGFDLRKAVVLNAILERPYR
ncbi:MAG: hypothetical protein H6601_04440 [Flavobacteriales bacterium]|nr:hypothetical protein [Flavobacteriales bacterium]